MKKIELIDLIIDALAGGDCPQELKGKYHPEIVKHHITLALNYLIQDIVYKEAERKNNFGYLDSYTKAFKNVEVLYDSDRDEKYSILPKTIVPLPKNRGLRMISAMKEQRYSFLYRDNNTVNIYGDLDVDSICSIPRFYVESDKVFYSEHLSDDIDKVLMKLVVDFSAYEDEDEVAIPSGYGKLVFDLVFQSMMQKGAEKMSNDNNSNVP